MFKTFQHIKLKNMSNDLITVMIVIKHVEGNIANIQ